MVSINGRNIGEGFPTYIIAEIGINHNGDVITAKRLIDVAVEAGCDAVKFQKRTPELCVPEEQKDVMRDTPWGYITYMEYRNWVELSEEEYEEIGDYCAEKDITWFASCWDEGAVDFMEKFNTPCYKIPSACLTNNSLLKYISEKNRPVILSTGMSTMEQIKYAVGLLDTSRLLIAHCTSTYPAKNEELNLNMIKTLQSQAWIKYTTGYDCPIGYSGHERGLQTTLAAVVLGATFVERHITLDRSMWGSDHAASLEPEGLKRLVRDIRVIESARGDGVKKVYESEIPIMKRLRNE